MGGSRQADIFEITETEDVVSSPSIDASSVPSTEFRELLREVQNLRDGLDQLTQVQIDLAQMIQVFQTMIEQKLDAISDNLTA